MVATRTVFRLRPRAPEDHALGRERLAKEFSGECRHRGLVVRARGRGHGRAGGDTAESIRASALAQPLLEAPDQHAHFHALRAPVLMRLVEHDELPVPAPVRVEQRTVIRADE